ncbi:MDR family MFS transporter [Gorillibacterium sp. sgz5001074]|uniref:MDR family MFS transporter n=1 Tax=Gorillibacterium sp. sgz5001074 TaxID=3446695 RepID=UPI003F67A977
MAAIIVGMFIVYLDQTVLNVILPNIITSLHSTYPAAQWTITGYSLAMASLIPIAGWLSDRFGAKPVLLMAIAWFGAASALCALSSTMEQLILFRSVQGISGGLVTPVGLAMIYRLSPSGQTGKVMAMISIPVLLAPAFGPILAGYLADHLSWHWVFLINVPLCLIGLLHGIRYLPRITSGPTARLDPYGLFLAPVAVVGLCYGLSAGTSSWHSTQTIGSFLTGFISLILLIVAELRQPEPLLELRVYRSRGFAKGSFILAAGQIAVFGSLYLLPQWLQNVRGSGAFESGLLMLPYAVSSGIVLQWSGKWFDRFGVRRLAIAGMCGLGIDGFLLARLEPNSSTLWIVLPIVLLGASSGLCMMPLSTHLMLMAPRELVSRVSSLAGASQQVIVSLTIAGLTTLLTGYMGSPVSRPPPLVQDWLPAFRITFATTSITALLGATIVIFIKNDYSLRNRNGDLISKEKKRSPD